MITTTTVTANGNKSFFNKSSHKRTPSDVQKASLIDKLISAATSSSQTNINQPVIESSSIIEITEIDPLYYNEIASWKDAPQLDSVGTFMTRVYTEDILPNLNFANKQVRIHHQKIDSD